MLLFLKKTRSVLVLNFAYFSSVAGDNISMLQKHKPFAFISFLEK